MNLSAFVVTAGMTLFVLMTGYLAAQRTNSKKAAIAALIAFCGMFVIVTAYRHLAVIYYPEQSDMFAAMDSLIFLVMFIFFFAWMAGISLWNWVKMLPPEPMRGLRLRWRGFGSLFLKSKTAS